jgi:hypothetical protein
LLEKKSNSKEFKNILVGSRNPDEEKKGIVTFTLDYMEKPGQNIGLVVANWYQN